MDAKQKFNFLYGITSAVMEQHQLYSSSYASVESHLNAPEVSKAFQSLEEKLQKQLDKLRKEAQWK